MRKNVLLLTMTSVLMSVCICACDRQAGSAENGHDKVNPVIAAGNNPIGVTAHFVVDGKPLPDSILAAYRVPEGISMEDLIRNLPSVQINDDGTTFINGKNTVRPQVSGVVAKMDGKDARPLTDEELAKSGAIRLPNELPEGETIENFMLKQPGVRKDDDGNIILASGKKVTSEDIDFIEKLQYNK